MPGLDVVSAFPPVYTLVLHCIDVENRLWRHKRNDKSSVNQRTHNVKDTGTDTSRKWIEYRHTPEQFIDTRDHQYLHLSLLFSVRTSLFYVCVQKCSYHIDNVGRRCHNLYNGLSHTKCG